MKVYNNEFADKIGNKIGSKIGSKMGYIAVEASIFLPVFIIGMVTLACIIKYAIVFERVSQIAFDENRVLVRNMYITAAALIRQEELSGRIEEEIPAVRDFDSSLLYPMPFFAMTDKVLGYTLEYDTNMPLPNYFSDKLLARQNFVFRPFVGKDNSSEKLQNPSEEEDYIEVWVFPRAGGKYHKEKCSYIDVCARQGLLTAGIAVKYSPCELCGSRDMKNGDAIFYFPKAGAKYHHASCTAVDRYVISMDIRDAEAAGYSPCRKCGGN